LVFVASCVAKIDEGAPVVGDGERLVTLSLTTPSSSPTRALTGTQEDAVHTVDVLLFKGEYFFYRAIGSTLDASKNFTVKLPSNAAPYKAVVLANARAMLSAIPLAQEQTSGTTRTSLLASITQTLSGSVPDWTSALATAGIPMWGYENDLAVNESSYNPAATIALTRMVARIDITVAAAVTNFKLASARLYNYSVKGSIAPTASTSSGSGYDATQWNGLKAIAPHLPTGAKVGAGEHIDYTISPAPGSVSFTNEIYAYEAQAGTANTVTNTCLVIGGYYEGSTSPTYYRVEFVGTDGTTFFHLLRNHKYAVEIKEVSAHGYSSANDAYVNKPANIVVQIVPWNEGGLDDITFGPQHYLAVDKSTLTFYSAGGSKTMEAITDFPAGWTIEKDAVYDWFTVAPLTHTSTSQQTITVTIPNGNGPRDGHFDIVAGNLHKRIFVTQSTEEEFSIVITDLAGNPLDELAFEAGNTTDGALPAAQSFRMTWLPASANCEVTLTPVAGMPPFTFNTSGSGVNPVSISPLTDGSEDITIQPDPLFPNDPNPLSRLDFSVTSGGQYRTAVLYLRQVNNYVIVESVAVGYDADGATTHSFTVKSNCSWLSYLDGGGSDLDDLINWKTSGGGPNPAGEPFKFILNSRTDPEPATISFTNLDHSLTYATATIHGVTPPPPYLTLDETTYKTNTSGEHSKEVTMTTNIPASRLGATVTGAGGQVTGATIVADPTLKVDFNNTLTGSSIQTYTVDVTYDAQVMATLTVRVFGSGWETIGGKLAGPMSTVNAPAVLIDSTLCPTGSSQPRTPEEAMWYEANLGGMQASPMLHINSTGIHNLDGVIWLGSPRKVGYAKNLNGTVSNNPFGTSVSCILNQTLVSSGSVNTDVTYQGKKYSLGYGQIINLHAGGNSSVTMSLRCVVWD
jgi:hypothetical protein